jgi:hypothetical protein
LENARLNGADLTEVLLCGANLHGAHLTEAKVRSADFRHANLSETAWHNTFVVNTALDDATLTAANLRRTTLMAASLTGSSLREADLTGALLSGVNLTRTDLSGACFAETFIADCWTLHEALGLSAVIHLAPSSLDVRTLRACVTYLPDAFLQSVGYTAEEIHQLKILYAQPTRWGADPSSQRRILCCGGRCIAVTLLLSPLEGPGDLRHQVRWGRDTLQLVAESLEGSGLEYILRGTHGAHLEMFVHQLHFVGG